jgi:hypothetical protein
MFEREAKREVGRFGRMKSDPRTMSKLAAAVTVALLAWAAPAAAAEDAATDVSAKAAFATGRRYVPARIATPRYVRAAPGQFECGGSWCGRHFVLMVGIGY